MPIYSAEMAAIKISSLKLEQDEWQALQELARESNQTISELLTEAIRDFVRTRRMRPAPLIGSLQSKIRIDGDILSTGAVWQANAES